MSRGILAILLTSSFDLLHSIQTQHWVNTSYEQRMQTSHLTSIISMSLTSTRKKRKCWDSLANIQDPISSHIILVGDLNQTLSLEEKRGGIFHKVHFRKKAKELMGNLYLLDVKPNMGKYTWTNRRINISRMSTRLDRFLVQSSLFLT